MILFENPAGMWQWKNEDGKESKEFEPALDAINDCMKAAGKEEYEAMPALSVVDPEAEPLEYTIVYPTVALST